MHPERTYLNDRSSERILLHIFVPTALRPLPNGFPDLNLPVYDLRTSERSGKAWVYDIFRKKYVRHTPEEHVRQQFVHYLMDAHGVPAGLIAIEQPVDVNGQSQRADVVVYDRRAHPLLLVECKAPSQSIEQAVFDQASRYNLALDAPFLVVTNGREHYACRINRSDNNIDFLPDLPTFEDMVGG
jgi:hypothetical protein